MRALNAAALKPISVLSDRKIESRKNSSLSTASPLKLSSSFNLNNNQSNLTEGLSSKIHGGLLILSSAAGTGFATALTYDEVLQQSVRTSTSEGFSGFDVGGFIDTVVNFGVENPAVVVGGIVILAVPLVLSQVLGKPKPRGVESARNAYTKLADDGNTQLLDIRAQAELRKVGSPDIRGLKKKPVAVAYKGEDKPGFLKKLSLKFKEPENATLFILDKFDGNSELVAELVTANGFKAAYAIKDGAEGSRGWMNSSLPWILPKKTPSLDFSNLTDAISDAIGDGVDGLSVALGVAAATGFGLLAFSEVETILQLFGSAALVQFVSKKLLFAEDRKQTIEQVDAFLNTKVAPKEFVDDIKQIGKALLPSPVTSKALPAPAQATSTATMPQEKSASPKVAIAESTPEINSVPKSEVKAESHPGIAKPLSPYPCYPDFKPPTSPTPSQP